MVTPRSLAWICAAAVPAVLIPAQGVGHWSYQPIVRPPLPIVADVDWCREPLDRFTLAAMVARGLKPSAPAERGAWLRRVSLDLCGLPPSPEQVAEFVADAGVDARERAVDALLQSPAFGERWALWWLDLARYADSQGYEKDDLRPGMWRWRDWVVDAFQRDLPFDQFTIEQLAGDLLPAPTLDQQVATAFHRQTMTNTEGGTDDEEFRTAAVIDRINTTMSVWMGSTVGCAQCHDHKYDPISQREYFGLYAFFDQTADRDRDDEAPTIAAPTAAQQQRVAAIDAELAGLRARIDDAVAARGEWLRAQQAAAAALRAADPQAGTWQLLGPVTAESLASAFATAFAPERAVALEQIQEGLAWQARTEWTDGVVHELRGERSAFYLHRTITAVGVAGAVLALGSDDGIKVWWNGELVLEHAVERGAAPDQEFVPVTLRPGQNEVLLKVVNGSSIGGCYFELRPTAVGAAVAAAVQADPDRGDARARRERDQQLRAAFAATAPAVAKERERIAALERERVEVAMPMVAVLAELPAAERRTTHLFVRGSFLTPAEVVTPGVPACWPPLAAAGPDGAVRPRDRLALARWLVAADNPLTARVQVNRIWEQLFGRGLVASSEDFGVQGERPTHPELLDWLAREFVDAGWSLRRLLRHIVLSATYGQSSRGTAAGRALDPTNTWLGRGAAFRLPGELLRDQALAVSGRLSARRGGPSVMPEQPVGVWGQIYSGATWQTSAGEDRHRRSLYTLWRRTSPHPAMTTFDAPSREFCVVRRVPTNTPLQALVLWNDPQFTDCAEALGQRVAALPVAAGADGDRERIAQLFAWCLLRAPSADECDGLLAFVRAERAAARTPGDDLPVWSRCATVLFGTDEFVTRN